ncbi:hypothetical protein F4778DRAFT_642641 [Xylariomycetidae sp. FL2044]|nr:hypothetical protein F4778DRAFT_642641 [Xylariomycetidae sp. FL2044]
MRSVISSALLVTAVAGLPSRNVGRQEPAPADFQASANRLIPVVVGGPQDTFVPNSVTAAVGDIIQFQFSNGNHTVTQSAADAACQPLQATVATAIHSGHIPYEDGATEVGTFNMPVTSADTMFLYCATGPHCQEGQVMIVNPTDDQQILDYAALAAASGSSVDGTTVVGGTVGTIPLEAAAFVPAPAEEEAAPPAEAAPAEEAPAETAVADPAAAITVTLPGADAGATAVPGTTTVVVTVTPAAEGAAEATPVEEAAAAEEAPAEEIPAEAAPVA